MRRSHQERHSQPALLRVSHDDELITSIAQDSLPFEREFIVDLANRHATIVFASRDASRHIFDLGGIRSTDFSYAHLSVRVHTNLAVQADCVLAPTSNDPRQAFERGELPGVRFQPFFLPGSGVETAQFVGRGLFERGLHFSGFVTPGNVSIICLCDVCSRSFHLQSFHAGFSECVYFYCDSGIHTLIASGRLPDAPPLLACADDDSLLRFESALPTCSECGGHFRYYNPLRCPYCTAPYIDFARYPLERVREYYGNTLFGDRTQSYRPATT